MNPVRVFRTNGPDETRSLGRALGRLLRAGDLVCLIGDLGAGKTTWTQGLALGLDLPADEPVNSPTFTLVAEHSGGRVPLYHLDVYRLEDPAGVYDLAFDEYLDGDGVVVIEWADRIAALLPLDRLEVVLQAGDAADVRQIRLTGRGPRAAQVVQSLESGSGA